MTLPKHDDLWPGSGRRGRKKGTQLTHPRKAAGGRRREDLEDERDGFGKLPAVKPFPPVQLLQLKISANKKNQLASAILSGAHKTMSEGASCEQIVSQSYEPFYLFVSTLSGAGNQSSRAQSDV